jgi:glycosyltransferase involved in cell wall biosynthesis
MRLVVQIPCFNEEKSLLKTIEDIPDKIDGIDEINIVVIDDGSTDNTLPIARSAEVNHIVKNTVNKGLGNAFYDGLEASLNLGADIIVNTDGDRQYKGGDIPKLIEPILKGNAEIVIGNRQTEYIPDYSYSKKRIQKIGRLMVRILTGIDVPDAVSGFRAFSRRAALQMNIVSSYSHTIETIIHASKKNIKIVSVPIETNSKTRESRLMKSALGFIINQLIILIRTYTMYQPFKVFLLIGILLIGIGLIPSIRFLIYFLTGNGSGHIQSIILGAVFLLIGFQVIVMGLIADIISVNRKLIEDIFLKIKIWKADIEEDRIKKCD